MPTDPTVTTADRPIKKASAKPDRAELEAAALDAVRQTLRAVNKLILASPGAPADEIRYRVVRLRLRQVKLELSPAEEPPLNCFDLDRYRQGLDTTSRRLAARFCRMTRVAIVERIENEAGK